MRLRDKSRLYLTKRPENPNISDIFSEIMFYFEIIFEINMLYNLDINAVKKG